MRRTNRKAKDESTHQEMTLDQELRNRDKLGHNDPDVSLDEKFIKHIARWASFVSYHYCEVNGDMITFNAWQPMRHAMNFINKQAPHLTVTARYTHINYSIKVNK